MNVEPPQQEQDKALDSTSALQKVLRLDKKHTNFDFHDPLRGVMLKVAYPQVQPEGPSSETLLKSLWRHACNYYFKQIEDSQLRRMHYLKNILGGHCESMERFDEDQDFWSAVDSIYSEEFLHKYLKGDKERLELQNSKQALHIKWQLIHSRDSKFLKRNYQACLQNYEDIQDIYSASEEQTSYHDKLVLERKRMKENISPAEYNDINDEIHLLERQLRQVTGDVNKIYQRMEERVVEEIAVQEFIHCEAKSPLYMQREERPRMDPLSARIDKKLEKLANFQILTKYIQYTIRQLERKQIAQSVTKILKVERPRGYSGGQARFTLIFEEAMDIRSIVVPESEFKAINNLRQYSLLKFYNTASKSRYSFICQNYLGFKDMVEHRNIPCRLKDRDILEEMKKTPVDPASSNYLRSFNQMEICHHCKLLHPLSALVKCEYKSSKCGTPVPPSPYYDSYVFQVMRGHHGCHPDEQSRVSALRSLNGVKSRKNSYFHYLKKDQEFVCDRKYCRFCLKNYEDGRERANGLCPYCRGLCYCTRCTRNQTMVRLKSMYVLLGGDIHHLQKGGIFEKYYSSSGSDTEDSPVLRRKQKSHKHKRSSSAPNRQNEKMVSIRYQLEDLRLICDLVKRREKNKEKLASSRSLSFRKKIEMVDPSFKTDSSSVKSNGVSRIQSNSNQAKNSDKFKNLKPAASRIIPKNGQTAQSRAMQFLAVLASKKYLSREMVQKMKKDPRKAKKLYRMAK